MISGRYSYEWAYLFGAVGAALVMPHANTDALNAHLQEIVRHVAPGAHAVLVLDGVGWHTSHALIIPDNLTGLVLPPYAPEINPVENIWLYLRQNQLAIRLDQSYEAIVDACCKAWNDVVATPERITSIATCDWAKIS